jgi:DNA-binding NarL/FixJ family response regulator
MDSPPLRTDPKTIRVMIVDDHPMYRSGLEQALRMEEDIEVVGYSDSGAMAMRVIAQLQPDVLLLDVNLPDTNGMQVARLLKPHYPRLAIIILTAHHDSEQTIHALRSGASAYCAKDISQERLVKLVRTVSLGYFVIGTTPMNTRQMEAWLTEQITHSSGYLTEDGHFIPLSQREMQILEYVTRGLLNKEIGNLLGISQQTVKNHMTSILKKLNVKDRTQAAVIAIRRGWVRVDQDTHREA